MNLLEKVLVCVAVAALTLSTLAGSSKSANKARDTVNAKLEYYERIEKMVREERFIE